MVAFIFLYLATYGLGVMILCACGFDLVDSLFEFASAIGTVGLSVGVTTPQMPGIAPMVRDSRHVPRTAGVHRDNRQHAKDRRGTGDECWRGHRGENDVRKRKEIKPIGLETGVRNLRFLVCDIAGGIADPPSQEEEG